MPIRQVLCYNIALLESVQPPRRMPGIRSQSGVTHRWDLGLLRAERFWLHAFRSLAVQPWFVRLAFLTGPQLGTSRRIPRRAYVRTRFVTGHRKRQRGLLCIFVTIRGTASHAAQRSSSV